ncbi:MAG: hypothetical protein L6Q99_06840 [Planctomycetes bacterium]|nr:hypothetical protein [Planctomycetota bacterium]
MRNSFLVSTVSCVLASVAAAQQPTYTAEFLGAGTGVTRMNASGVIVGHDTTTFGGVRGWVAKSGSAPAALPLPAGRLSSWANDINDAGVIVGAVSSSSFSPEFGGVACAWYPKTGGGYDVVEFGILPGDNRSNALGVNDVGDVVGFSADSMFRVPVLFTGPSGLFDLSATGVFDPQKINDQRVLVDVTGKRLDLDTLVVENLGHPAGSYSAVNCADINESGQVAASAILTTSTNCNRQVARYSDVIGWEVFGNCGQHNGATAINDLGDMLTFMTITPYVRFEGEGTFAIDDLISPAGQWASLVWVGGRALNDARQIAIGAQNLVTGQVGVVLLTRDVPVGTTICSGDGSVAACPCGNSSVAGEGCKNSSGVGAKLAASGSASVAADDLVLRVTQAAANKPALFFQGVNTIAVPFQDGILCAGGAIKRLQAVTLDASGAAQSTVSIVAQGAVVPGVTRTYQAWFRDPQGPCGTSSNLSSAVQLTWL